MRHDHYRNCSSYRSCRVPKRERKIFLSDRRWSVMDRSPWAISKHHLAMFADLQHRCDERECIEMCREKRRRMNWWLFFSVRRLIDAVLEMLIHFIENSLADVSFMQNTRLIFIFIGNLAQCQIDSRFFSPSASSSCARSTMTIVHQGEIWCGRSRMPVS